MALWTVYTSLNFALLCTATWVTQGHTPVTANPADVVSIDAIIHALYESVSGPAGQKHDWTQLRTLFTPSARMGEVWRNGAKQIQYDSFSVDEYIANNDAGMAKNGWLETERRRHVDTFGNIAQVFSSYEGRSNATEKKPEYRGINSLTLINDGKRWWITSIQWQSEDASLKLPRNY